MENYAPGALYSSANDKKRNKELHKKFQIFFYSSRSDCAWSSFRTVVGYSDSRCRFVKSFGYDSKNIRKYHDTYSRPYRRDMDQGGISRLGKAHYRVANSIGQRLVNSNYKRVYRFYSNRYNSVGNIYRRVRQSNIVGFCLIYNVYRIRLYRRLLFDKMVGKKRNSKTRALEVFPHFVYRFVA